MLHLIDLVAALVIIVWREKSLDFKLKINSKRQHGASPVLSLSLGFALQTSHS